MHYPAWFGLNLPKSVLLGELSATDRRYDGDVDILVGGGVPDGDGIWRPVTDEWAAIEAKVSWYGRLGDTKSTKEGRLESARQQAHDHLYLGARSATLLWIAVTEPVQVPGHHPWMVAASRDGDAWDAFRKLKGYKELAERADDAVGFTFFPWGAVAGGAEHTEEWAGAGAPQVVRGSERNPYSSEPSIIAAHGAMSRVLAELFGAMRFPDLLSGLVLVLCCSGCRRLFLSGTPPQDRCTECRPRGQSS